ncbi:MAG: tRNA pseudouridine(38-40) synthase TruA [Candidatus Amoebophilus sp.]
MRYFLEISYQGTHYHGWQIQQNATSVQAVIQKKLTQLLSTNIEIVGSSRTDTGVHAQQQFAHVDTPFTIDIDKLKYKLNLILPSDIAILGIHPVIPTAHSRFDALSRTYVYKISCTKNPFMQATTYVFRRVLDLEKMNEAAAILKIYKDFESFSKIGSITEHTLYPNLCNIIEAHWSTGSNDQLIFQITANRFLRGMVRAIVGNLLEVGLGKCSVKDFEYNLVQKDRSLAASLVPACGLTLVNVTYPDTIFTV